MLDPSRAPTDRPLPAFATFVFVLAASLSLPALVACNAPEPAEQAPEPATAALAAEREGRSEPNPLRNAYFGDLHVHTRYSFDAFVFGTRSTPEDAYRYAKGEAIQHAGGFEVKLRQPLDFLAVTDHAEFLGAIASLEDPDGPLGSSPLAAEVRGADEEAEMRTLFRTLGQRYVSGELQKLLVGVEPAVRDAWLDTVAAADRANDPGRFTAFAGYEYTSAPEQQNLHRNVIFRRHAPDRPFSSADSQNPEDLWAWLDARRAEGIEALAIPHNSNGSNGQMFELVDWAGDPLDAEYTATRLRNEPLVEITQVKGTSDTHPLLSPNDEWADFEIFPFRISTSIPSEPRGSYVREALLHGLELEAKGAGNPWKVGVIGSSDTHNGAGSYDEKAFFSKVGALDDTPVERGSVPLPAAGAKSGYAETNYDLWGASGLAGVWAEENTRESIYDALRRKETFATTGPRLRVRFFAGYDFEDGFERAPDAIAEAYAGGVPMGGDLAADGDRTPRFLVWAMRDPSSALLQRVQVIKGWLEGDTAREQVFDVACSGGTAPGTVTRRCPDNGAMVNVADCSIVQPSGAAELTTLWSDPSFDPAQRAFYYVRVLENPTCRWSTWDAVRAGVAPNPALPATLQERAWSSPIWFTPAP